ncbi:MULTISPECIES: hypothetical protein [Streptomyces]|uniref:hypothetical protein n=1 Tax=Streptomyces TaxID=1883 RepID=UPI000A68E2F9|nr:hypothetical protein [Streptomyces virginiae]
MEHEQTIPEQRKGDESAPEQDTSAPRRRKGRTTLLIAGAAALGVLAGTITGYAVQYHREPTPLPPLAQQKMAAPKPQAMSDATTRRSINANRWHKADEELAKKLLDVPGGAKSDFSGALSVDMFAAGYYKDASGGLGGLITDRIRSIASADWSESDRNFVEINLLQFSDRNEAEDFQLGIEHYMPTKEYAGNAGKEVPGVPEEFGHMWVDSDASEKPGYHPLRAGRAVVRRGDIVVSIQYTNNRGEVDESVLADLAKRQMERL